MNLTITIDIPFAATVIDSTYIPCTIVFILNLLSAANSIWFIIDYLIPSQ